MSYCPKCKSKLYIGDVAYMDLAGVCSYCVTNDTTPDQRFRKAYDDGIRAAFAKQGKKPWVKKTVVSAIFLLALPINMCLADSLTINKERNSTIRTENRHYYEYEPGDAKQQGSWKMKNDRLFIQERDNDKSNKSEKKGK